VRKPRPARGGSVRLDFESPLQIFATNLLHVTRDTPTGICYLIDEADELDKDVNLAPFLKAVVEKLRMDGYQNVSFIISGVTGIVTQLVSQHPSSARLTENVNIEKMEPVIK
jgi:hypothetical protein